MGNDIDSSSVPAPAESLKEDHTSVQKLMHGMYSWMLMNTYLLITRTNHALLIGAVLAIVFYNLLEHASKKNESVIDTAGSPSDAMPVRYILIRIGCLAVYMFITYKALGLPAVIFHILFAATELPLLSLVRMKQKK